MNFLRRVFANGLDADLIRLFRLRLPQDHALCHDIGPLGQRAPSLCTESVRPPFYALIPPPDSWSRAA